MISQKITYHPNTYIIHEFFEYDEDQLTIYERYNINEKLEYQKSDIMECHYLNGQPHGTYKGWHENGQPQLEINYHNGELHGSFKTWYENGKPSSEANYVNGKKHGIYKEWYNGQLQYECNYHNGQPHGLCKSWDIYDNTICTETFYIHGVKQ
jgi:antitoxin component YwqK of YwqJK toxin-antitoxin module